MWDQQTLLAPDGWLGNAILGTAESSGSYSVYPSMRIGISVSCGKEFGFPLRSFAFLCGLCVERVRCRSSAGHSFILAFPRVLCGKKVDSPM